MGSMSIWHWIIVTFFLAIPACIGVVLWLILRAAKKPTAISETSFPSAIPAATSSSAEARLQELTSLRSKGLITGSEFEQKRSAVLRSV